MRHHEDVSKSALKDYGAEISTPRPQFISSRWTYNYL